MITTSGLYASSRYFFHASEARKADEDYEGDEDEPMEAAEHPASIASSETEDEDFEAVPQPAPPSPPEEPEQESDPELADWFKVDGQDKGKGKAREEDIAESETEPESDNDDVRDENADIDDLVDDLNDDWFKVSTSEKVSSVVQ